MISFFDKPFFFILTVLCGLFSCVLIFGAIIFQNEKTQNIVRSNILCITSIFTILSLHAFCLYLVLAFGHERSDFINSSLSLMFVQEKKQTDGSNINPHTIHASNGFQSANYFHQESNPLMSLSSNAISPTSTMPTFYTSFPEEIYEPFSDMNLPNFNPSNEYLPNESYSVCSNTLSYIEPEFNVSIQGNAPKNSNSSLQVSNKSYALISKDDSSEESFDTNSSSSDESDGNNAEQYPPSSSLSRPENLRILILNRAKYVSPNIGMYFNDEFFLFLVETIIFHFERLEQLL